MTLIENIEATLWGMANELRGTMDASEYKNYILGFLFYMFLSDRQEKYLVDEDLITVSPGQSINDAYVEQVNTPDLVEEYTIELANNIGYAIAPKNTWVSLVKKVSEGVVIPSDYQDIFDAFNQSTKLNKDAEKDFQGIFNDINLGDSRLGTTTVERARALGKIVDLVNSVNLDETGDKDILGQIYEYLIKQFAATAGKKGGEFYTPHEVSKIIARIVTMNENAEVDETFTVYDPACGSGSLLLTVGSCLKNGNNPGAIHYYGQELNTTTYNLARMNLMMHNVSYRYMTLSNADTLGPDWPDGPDAKGVDHPRKFDAVVANPPYSARWDADETRIRDMRFKDFEKLAPKSKADYAFLLHGLYHLDHEGTMAIVLPHGVLFRGNAEGTIREILIKKNYVDTIIGLPANLFYGTSIPTVIIVLKRNKENKDILFIDASQHFKKDKNKNTLTEDDINRILDAYTKREDIEKYSHVASSKEIKDNDYNLNIPRYVDTSEEEPEINLQEVLEKIHKTKEEIHGLEKTINEQLELLGVIKNKKERL